VSCEDSFTKLRQEDLALRAQLLEDAKREEQVEKERAKKRKKVDRSKLHQDERDEAEMDVEELAVKDLKERLLQQDKSGVVKVDGRVNESVSAKYAPREADSQVTVEDASYWLLSQKPYIRPKLFVRAEAARIVTKSLL
jgi:ribonucleotide reductase alpha subunit